jgi:hypothetical protein
VTAREAPSLAALRVTLQAATRRHRAPPLPPTLDEAREGDTWTALAYVIERARQAVECRSAPAPEEAALFTESLLHLIRAALRPERGDPSFQAMVLRHHEPRVREYASLSAHADQDRRRVVSLVNAMAHPAKLERRPPGPLRAKLSALREAAARGAWLEVKAIIGPISTTPAATGDDTSTLAGLTTLRDEPSLAKLIQWDELGSDALVLRYRALIQQQGPTAGSEAAADRGARAQRRGATVEAAIAEAMSRLAGRLNEDAASAVEAEAPPRGRGAATPWPSAAAPWPSAAAPRPSAATRWCSAASLRVPGTLVGDMQGAKVEWDVALLRRASDTAWDLVLLIEAKASAEAASTDLPRLVRGLRLLRAADAATVYPFQTHDGELRLTGASLAALDVEAPDFGGQVLYCCDGDEDQRPRLLSAASRMQLLSAAASLDVAARLERGETVEPSALEPVWHQLLSAPQFVGVLHQYPSLQRVREVMLHPDDLASAVDALS